MNNAGVPQTLYPSNNPLGVPVLPIASCADSVAVPFLVWGFQRRSRKAGTIAFYTDDYRYSAIWGNPALILSAQPIVAIECNWTLQDDQPRTVALWQTYRKRWLACLWAQAGVRLIVDLNVSPRHAEDNLLGVPMGWRAFATRGATADMDGLNADYAIACRYHPEPLFVVYGGGSSVRQVCMDRGWYHVHEAMDRRGG